jgi:NAD(P)-dependent dehydrogenase (short-subunit alcohol dehydrogenase family)
MQGKTVLITGADGGIGRNTTKGIAQKNARIIMACIDVDLAKPVLDEIIKETNNKDIEIMHLDLSSQSNIHKFAENFISKYSSLDVLINNAGVFSLKRFETEDDLERTIGINYFGHFLLTHLLLPVLEKSGEARIINVSSDSYKQSKFDLNNLQTEIKYTGMKAYTASKLALILFTQELAEQLKDKNTTVNTLHPGHVSTGIWNMWEHPKWYQTLIVKILNTFFISPEKGAETSIYLACSNDVKGTSGKYFSKKKPVRVSSKYNNIQTQKELWTISKYLTKLI